MQPGEAGCIGVVTDQRDKLSGDAGPPRPPLVPGAVKVGPDHSTVCTPRPTGPGAAVAAARMDATQACTQVSVQPQSRARQYDSLWGTTLSKSLDDYAEQSTRCRGGARGK